MVEPDGTTVRVCLEIGVGATGAFVPDRPGCWVFGRDSDSALSKVRAAAEEWSDWLSSHGEKVRPDARLLAEPAEILHVNYNPALAGKPEPLFWSEVPPVSGRDIKRVVQLMEYSRNDLLELASGLDQWSPAVETSWQTKKHQKLPEAHCSVRMVVHNETRYPPAEGFPKRRLRLASLH